MKKHSRQPPPKSHGFMALYKTCDVVNAGNCVVVQRISIPLERKKTFRNLQEKSTRILPSKNTRLRKENCSAKMELESKMIQNIVQKWYDVAVRSNFVSKKETDHFRAPKRGNQRLVFSKPGTVQLRFVRLCQGISTKTKWLAIKIQQNLTLRFSVVRTEHR